MEQQYDVLIIGGGVVGSAVAREMSRYQLKIGVLEKNLDVCYETSGRNSGVVHGGFAYDRGSLKARLCVEGNRMMNQLSEELGFRFIRCGKVLVGNTPEDMETLKRTLKQGEDNGSEGLVIIDKEELHRLVPAVVGEFAMFSPNSGIVDPFNYTIALAENAHDNGVDYYFDHEVTGIERGRDGTYAIETSKGTFYTRWVVNSAGLGCGTISDMLGIRGYKVIGSKGDYIILDKRTGPLLPMPVYPVPSNTYMGIHVTNTTDGNVIIGPNAETVTDFAYYGVPQRNMDYLAESASKLWPCIHKGDYIRNYSGILPKWVDDEGVVSRILRLKSGTILRSPGHQSGGNRVPGTDGGSPHCPLCHRPYEREGGVKAGNPGFNPIRNGIVRFAEQTKEEQARMIQENPDYGEVICRCEKVTKAELLQAIHNPLGVDTMVGIKYRTRAMMGKCQGGYCQCAWNI